MAFKVGDKTNGYEFLRVLGSAGAAVVYEVLNHNQGRREMLKLLPRELLENQEGVDRFAREAKVRARLTHPNIAALYEAVTLDGQPALTMEMSAGESLEQRLSDGPITMGESVEIAINTLRALEYAHDRQVVHREVSPSNIYLLPDRSVKLTGFGLAKQYADPKLTAPGAIIGQVHYLSPEQVKGSSEIDGRSDLYSLGVVLFEALTGQKPFDSKSQFDIIQAHVLEAPPVPSDLREDLPKDLERIVLKALEKFPGDRYQDARQFRSELEAAATQIRSFEREERPYQVRDPIDDLEDEAQPAAAVELPPALRAAIDRRRKREVNVDPQAAIAEAEPASRAPRNASPQPQLDTAAPRSEAVASSSLRPQDLALIGLITVVMVAATLLTLIYVFGL